MYNTFIWGGGRRGHSTLQQSTQNGISNHRIAVYVKGNDDEHREPEAYRTCITHADGGFVFEMLFWGDHGDTPCSVSPLHIPSLSSAGATTGPSPLAHGAPAWQGCCLLWPGQRLFLTILPPEDTQRFSKAKFPSGHSPHH